MIRLRFVTVAPSTCRHTSLTARWCAASLVSTACVDFAFIAQHYFRLDPAFVVRYMKITCSFRLQYPAWAFLSIILVVLKAWNAKIQALRPSSATKFVR